MNEVHHQHQHRPTKDPIDSKGEKKETSNGENCSRNSNRCKRKFDVNNDNEVPRRLYPGPDYYFKMRKPISMVLVLVVVPSRTQPWWCLREARHASQQQLGRPSPRWVRRPPLQRGVKMSTFLLCNSRPIINPNRVWLISDDWVERWGGKQSDEMKWNEMKFVCLFCVWMMMMMIFDYYCICFLFFMMEWGLCYGN